MIVSERCDAVGREMVNLYVTLSGTKFVRDDGDVIEIPKSLPAPHGYADYVPSIEFLISWVADYKARHLLSSEAEQDTGADIRELGLRLELA